MVVRQFYKSLPKEIGPYVHGIKHNGILYISGLTAYDTDTQSKTLNKQNLEVLSQINRILLQEKCYKENFVKKTILMRYISQISNIREHLFDFYCGHYPARTFRSLQL
ncbi:TPA: RidA family protein [Vibrio harveyi]